MGSFQNLSGMKFNKLYVLGLSHKDKRGAHYWRCKCDCGNITVMRSNHLKSGWNKSCGCLHAEISKAKTKDISGEIFGRLTVLYLNGKNLWGENIWRCRCSCGQEVLVRGSSLKSGHSKSCGCYNRELESKARTKPGEQHWNWRGGVHGRYSPEWSRELREEIRNRDGRRCQYPGCDYDDTKLGNKRLDVHHVDGNKRNCKSYNLVSMCHSHHMKVETNGAVKWRSYFYEITGDYE